jgi:hypothetical protein
VSPERHGKRRLVFVDKPERTQTQILLGEVGSHPRDADHISLHVATTIFGGTFTSRMMKAIRSERGWSYGAYARLPYDKERDAFSMWTFPAAKDAAACITLELELLNAWRDKGISARELAFAKRYLVRSHAFDIYTPQRGRLRSLPICSVYRPTITINTSRTRATLDWPTKPCVSGFRATISWCPSWYARRDRRSGRQRRAGARQGRSRGLRRG